MWQDIVKNKYWVITTGGEWNTQIYKELLNSQELTVVQTKLVSVSESGRKDRAFNLWDSGTFQIFSVPVSQSGMHNSDALNQRH